MVDQALSRSASPHAAPARRGRWRLPGREAGVFVALVVMVVALTILSDRFLTAQNLLNVGRQVSLLGIMAVGMTFVIVSGEIDLSVGSTYAFGGLACGLAILAGAPLVVAVLGGLLCGTAIGVVNGLVSTHGRLPSLIATLGTLSMVRGLALIVTDGRPVTVNERNGADPATLSAFEFMGQGEILGIPMQLVCFAAVALLGWVLLTRTGFGFRVTAVGGSPKAARVSGISVAGTKIWAMTLMGSLAAFAGILSLAFLPSGQAGETPRAAIGRTTMTRLLASAASITLALAALPALAEPHALADFPLAERISDKIAAGEELEIYVSYHDVSNEFAPFIRAGVERANAEIEGINATFIGPVGADADAQINEIETLLDGMDALAISSVSTDALAPLIDRVVEAGIPVIAYNTDNPDSARLVFAGQDLVQSGREAGALMAETMGGEGQILMTTIDAAAQWSLDREDGAREALAEAPGITVVQTVNTGTDPQEIFAAIENAMLANPDVTGILSLECCSTPAAGEWVERAGRAGEVKVVGFDLLDQTVELVEAGAVQATIDQAPERQGFEAVSLLARFLGGETIDDLDTGVGVYTAENIAEAQ